MVYLLINTTTNSWETIATGAFDDAYTTLTEESRADDEITIGETTYKLSSFQIKFNSTSLT